MKEKDFSEILSLSENSSEKEYTIQNLAKILLEYYNKEKDNGIRMFGLCYGRIILNHPDINASRIVDEADKIEPGCISKNYKSELTKGINIYKSIKSGKYDISLHEPPTHSKFTDEPKLSGNRDLQKTVPAKYRPFITAIHAKPFLLLAGISGTGKSRIVRQLARACDTIPSDTNPWDKRLQKPSNFEMLQVRPNWRDSSELFGYFSHLDGVRYVAGAFIKFVIRAWENPNIPFFLCLDEMNLAPVEQYFADFLSVFESRKLQNDGKTITTDPLIIVHKTQEESSTTLNNSSQSDYNEKADNEWSAYCHFIESETRNADLQAQFKRNGICIPQNLIVVGTVNMDESTFSFSRKVLDRAMTIEMNEVDLFDIFTHEKSTPFQIEKTDILPNAVEAEDIVNEHNKDLCMGIVDYIQKINDVLEGTPFKVAYRTRNDILLYVKSNIDYCHTEDGSVIARALDEATSMKILSRIEGDESRFQENFFESLENAIGEGLHKYDEQIDSISLKKIREMEGKLEATGSTSFWS